MRDSPRRAFLKATVAGSTIGIAGCQERQTNQTAGGDKGTDADQTEPEPDADTEYEPVKELVHIGMTRSFSSEFFEFQQLAAQMLERIGISIDLQITQWSKLVDKFLAHDFDLMTMGGPGTPRQIDPYFRLYFLYHSKFIEEGNNVQEYDNPDYDEVAEKVKRLVDREERQKWVYKAQEILARDQPILYGYHPNSLSAANEQQFSGWTEQIGSQVYWNVPALTELEAETDNRTVIFGATRTPETLNPMAVQGAAPLEATKMIYTKLARYGLDGEAKPYGAKEFKWQDNTTLDAVIRDGMTFHDGEPMTAEDVKFSMDYIQEWGVPFLKSAYDSIEEVTIPQDGVVRFNLQEPFSAFIPQGLAFGLYILPKHIWGGIVEENNLEHPRDWGDLEAIGSGPFKLVQYETQNKVVYEPHEEYFLDFDFDKLVYKIYSSKASAVGDLENKQISFTQQLQASNFNRLTETSGIRAESKASHGAKYILLQNKREPLNDVKFRQALAYALDKQRIVDVVLEGYGEPSATDIAPATEFWHNPDLPLYEGGVEKAKNHLAKAGYRWDDQGNLLKPVQ